MNVVLVLLARNLRLFVRDRLGVFFSLLSAIILIGLYALFLGQNQIDSLAARFPNASESDVRGFVTAWVFAGVAMITTLTTAYSTVGAFVNDRASGRFQDFLVSPVHRMSIVLGYLLSGMAVAISVTLLVLVGSQVALALLGSPLMTVAQAASCVLWIVLSSVAFSAFSSFAVSFLRTQGALSALGTILGTVIGFLAGAYIPIGALPEGARNVVAALPFGQAAMLIREPLTHGELHRLTAGSAAAAEAVRGTYGLTMTLGTLTITPAIAATELIVVAVVFTALAVARLRSGIRTRI